MGLNAAVQALKKAEPLKDKVQRCKDLLNDNDAWVCQQQLQKIYQQVLILDLEYALDRKVEQELWNLGFKNYIATLQSQAKDKKNPKRGESQALLSWCLEAASGFYLTLLQEICTAFDLDLPFRRKGYVYGCTSPWKAVEKLSVPHKSSCFYACQYCLVHLGDIARYRNESKQAELFYRHAVSLSPSSGQPYNQLALLEASRGNKLGTVFHYARSVAVKHPFPVATANLAKTLSSALNDNSFNIDGKAKLTPNEYIALFLKLHGIIHNFGDIKTASMYGKLLAETLTALVATESFSSWMLVQMLVINLYALEYTAGIAVESVDSLKSVQITRDEKFARDCILDLIAGSLSALLLPVYTIRNSMIEYFALPSIKLCLDWIHTKPTVLEETAFTSRLQIWPSLCVLLNALQNSVLDFTHDQYVKVPLPEDRDLQGFLPLEKSFDGLKFTSSDLEDDVETSNKLRAVRILRLGRSLAQYKIKGSALIVIATADNTQGNRFSSIGESTGPSNELMKELEELSLNKGRQPAIVPVPVSTLAPAPASPVLSESASSKGSADADILDNSIDKRIGILKYQASFDGNKDVLMVSTDESSNLEINSALATMRKPRQNIAMQAIMRRAETEQKQVTFKNVSPVITEDEQEKQAKLSSASPVKTLGNRNIPVTGGESSKSFTVSNNGAPLTLRNRLPLMPHASANLQCPVTTSVVAPINQAKSKTQRTLPQLAQINQLASTAMAKEQQAAGSLQPPDTNQIVSGAVCYQNQTSLFNLPNNLSSQFTGNFMTNQIGSLPGYQIQGQDLNNPAETCSQNVLNLQHGLTQNRVFQQRIGQNVIRESMLQQNVGLTSIRQPNLNPEVSGNLRLQQQALSTIGLRTNVLPSHNQMGLTNPAIGNISALPTLNTYQKNLQQSTSGATSVPRNSLSPPGISNIQHNFGQSNFSQSNFVPMTHKQQSASIYGKSADMLEYQFPNQSAISKNSTQTTNSYPLFRNYEAGDFNLWNTATQQPSLPAAAAACWTPSTAASTVSSESQTSVIENYQNWKESGNTLAISNNTNAINATTIGGFPLTNCNYRADSLRATRQFPSTSNMDDLTNLEVDAKTTPQSLSSGNTYSLFSSNSWGSGNQSSERGSCEDQMNSRLHQQSLWSGPGPSPLERLLEQQKSLREGGT